MITGLHTLDTKLKRLNLGERLIRRNPLYYGSAQRQFAALHAADVDQRAAWTQERLRRILSLAARTDYGRSVGGSDEIESWPLLNKETVRNRPESFLAGGRWLSARADTSGTSGLPLKLTRSPESVAVEQFCFDSVVRRLRADPRTARIAVLRADTIKDASDTRPPFWIYALGGRRLILSSNHLSAKTLPHYIEELQRFAPDLLWVYPTALESLCILLQRANRRLRVSRVLSSSEMLQAEVWRLAKDTLGCEIADRYGQAERVAAAHAFAPQAFHFLPGYAYVELIPESEDDSTRLYEIVGTSFWNTAMPLVRYRTGDLIRLPRSAGARELQEVVVGLRAFEGVIGRSHDVLMAPDGAGVLTGVNHIPRSVENLVRLQVVQETLNRIVLRVLPAAEFSDADAWRLMRNARLKIPASIDVRIELVDALQRTERGKTPFVVHGPTVQAALRKLGFNVAAV
jgi:phenylacetate-CoA ligase